MTSTHNTSNPNPGLASQSSFPLRSCRERGLLLLGELSLVFLFLTLALAPGRCFLPLALAYAAAEKEVYSILEDSTQDQAFLP